MIKIHPDLLNFVRPNPHSKFSPSSMERFIACPYSVEPSQAIPNISSVYSIEGTLCHSICEALFNLEYYGIPFPNSLNMEIVEWENKNPGANSEMMDSARVYVDVVTYWLQNEEEVGDVLAFGLEKTIPIFPEQLCYGSADAMIVGTKGAVILDYKNGKGKNVSADSIQLRTYLAGVARHIQDTPKEYKFYSIVVQPRTDIAPKVATYTWNDMNIHLNLIEDTIRQSRLKDLQPCEGSHCFFCPLKQTRDPKLKCPLIKNKALDLANQDFNKFLSDMSAPIAEYQGENPKRDAALIKIISLLPLMQQIVKDGESEFLYRIEKGEDIPGIIVKEKLGNRSWAIEDEKNLANSLKEKFPDLELYKTKKSLKTITEIEKETKKGSVDTFTVRKASKRIEVSDFKIQEVLGEMAAYGNMLKGGDNGTSN